MPIRRQPIRLNKARIVISKINKNKTVLDQDFNQPIGFKEFQQEIEVPGQINFFSKSRYNSKTLLF